MSKKGKSNFGTWKGKRLEDMTKEELMHAMCELGQLYETALQAIEKGLGCKKQPPKV